MPDNKKKVNPVNPGKKAKEVPATRADSLFLLNNNKIIKGLEKKGYSWVDKEKLNKYTPTDWRYEANSKINSLPKLIKDDIKENQKKESINTYIDKKGKMVGTQDWKNNGGEDSFMPKQYMHPEIKPQYKGDLQKKEGRKVNAVYSYGYDDLAIKPFDLLNDKEKVQRVKQYGSDGVPKSYINKSKTPVATNTSSKKSEGPTVVKPYSKDTPQVKPIENFLNPTQSNNNISAAIPNIPTPVKQPKHYNVQDQIAGSANYINHTTNYKTNDPSNLVELSPNNKRTITPQYAMGGNLNKYAMGGELTEFNEGGLHEQNSNGGIPMGGNNTVEEGESKKGSFVYSNRIPINEDIVKEFNLPNYIKNKTIAEASKAINNQFKDRNDKPSIETKNTLLDRLANAQESIKAYQNKVNEAMQVNSQQVPDQMNGEIPAGMEEFIQPQQSQMFLGGELEGAEGATGGGYMSAMEPAMGGIQSLIAGDKDKALTSGITAGTTIAGTAIGGPIGGMIGGKIGELAGGIMTGISARKEARREDKRVAFKASNQFTNDFKRGGLLPFEDSLEGGPNQIVNPGINFGGAMFKSNSIPQEGAKSLASTPTTPITGTMPTSNKTDDTTTSDDNQSWLDKNGGKMLKYAPVAMNAFQLSQLKKPKYERLERLTNTYKPTYVDERNLQNIVSNENDNTINALTNASNGSEGALRSSILGANLNYTKGISDSYMKANELNNAQKQYKQQFDLGVDQVNMGQSNNELDINDRNTANYDSQKSKLIGSIGTDLGAIGKEEVNKNQIAEALGYSWDGKYMVNKKTGEKITKEELAKKNAGTPTTFGDVNKFVGTTATTKMYGGYIKTNKKGY